MGTNDERDVRLAATLGDAMWGCIWAALVTYALVWVSFGVYLAWHGNLPGALNHMVNLTPQALAIVWMAALALVKLTALTFAVMAFGLWVWRRRLTARIQSQG